MNYSFVFDVLPITFPLQGNPEEWRRLFKPCASQRLFLPVVLADVDSLLYVDTDTLFLGPLEDVWHHFELMNSSQIAALTPEHEDPNTGWYNRFARHPYYGKLGVNSGVMLMNLTRMRLFSWTDYVVPIYKEYKLTMTWGDQDIINIIFHFHPEIVTLTHHHLSLGIVTLTHHHLSLGIVTTDPSPSLSRDCHQDLHRIQVSVAGAVIDERTFITVAECNCI
uniref:UDP-D-xylose:beta-D-glucoside alpha-1,3-D-xylosyltransferase n=1 Tax=Timema poppense TaxID=170557 RepID=A0A7R9DSY8_TIMPO|nr:unnamed protein product [Timema poppensis]